MKNQRRILAVVLCVLMLITAIPLSPVMAEDTTETTTTDFAILSGEELYNAISSSTESIKKSLVHEKGRTYTKLSASSGIKGNEVYVNANGTGINFAEYDYYVLGYIFTQGATVLDFCFRADGNPKEYVQEGKDWTQYTSTWYQQWLNTSMPSHGGNVWTAIKVNRANFVGQCAGYEPFPDMKGQKFSIKPWNSMTADGSSYAGIQYAAFFKNEADRDAFVAKWEAATLDVDSYEIYIDDTKLEGDVDMLEGVEKQIWLYPSNAEAPMQSTLTFESSNTEALTVSDTGLIKGVAAGSAVVSVKNGETVVATINVNVEANLLPVIFSVGDNTISWVGGGTSHDSTKVKATVNDPAYYRLSVKSGRVGSTATDNDRSTISLVSGDYSMLKHKYIALRYRAKVANGGSSLNYNPVPYVPATGKSPRLWGSNTNFKNIAMNDNVWHTAVADLSAGGYNGGDSGWVAGDDGKISYEKTFTSYLKSLVIRPTNQGSVLAEGDTFDVAFLGFFTTEEEARDYVFDWEKPHTVTYIANGETFATDYFADGESLVLPTATPSKEGLSFKGWYTSEEGGTRVTTSTKVDSDLTLYARFAGFEPVAMYDRANLKFKVYESYKTAFENVDQIIPSSAYDFEENMWTITQKSGTTIKTGDDDEIDILVDVPASAAYAKLYMYANSSDNLDNVNVLTSGKGGRMWGYLLTLNSGNELVLDMTKASGGSGSIKWDAIPETDRITAVRFKPYKSNSKLPDTAEIKVRYIAFFETLEAANNYKYTPSEAYKVIYLNEDGSEFDKQYYGAGSMLTLPSGKPSKAGYAFTGWKLNDTDITDGYIVNSELTLTPVFKMVIPTVLITADDFTASVSGGFKSHGILEDDGKKYHHFTVHSYDVTDKDGNVTSTVTSSQDGTRAYINFKSSDFPEGFKLYENKYVKVGYRGQLATALSQVDFNPEPRTNLKISNGYDARLWTTKPQQTLDGTWQAFTYDLTTRAGGAGGVAQYKCTSCETVHYSNSKTDGHTWVALSNDEYNEQNLSSYMMNLQLKPYGSNGRTFTEGDYYDVLYVAFFDNAEDAALYDYFTELEYTVKYTVDGEEYTSQTYMRGDKLAYPAAPEKEGYKFAGWSVAEGTAVKFDMTVEASFKKIVDPTMIFVPSDFKISVGSKTSGSFVAADENDIEYAHYVFTAGKSDDNTRAYVGLPYADYNLVTSKYIKIGYRTNIDSSGGFDFNPMPVDPSRRMWSYQKKTVVSDESWQEYVYDLSSTKFTRSQSIWGNGSGVVYPDNYTGDLENIPQDDETQKAFYEANFNGVMRNLCLKPYYGECTIDEGDYFDVSYVAFFDTLEDAEDYVFNANVDAKEIVTVNVNVGENGSLPKMGMNSTTRVAAFRAVVGTTVKLTAVPDDNYKMDGWYNVTNGHNIQLSRDSVLNLTVDKDIDLDLRFYDEAVDTQARLVVLPDADNAGTVTAEGVDMGFGDDNDSYLDIYVSTRKATKLTATPKNADTHYAAYWIRISEDHYSFIAAGDSIDAYPLGNSVHYQPVYGTVTDGVKSVFKIYVDFANSIIDENPETEPAVPERAGYTVEGWVKDTSLSSDTVEVYKPSYKKNVSGNTLTVEWSKSSWTSEDDRYEKQVLSDLNYDTKVDLTPGGSEFGHWLIIVQNGMGEEKKLTLSHKSKYSYYHALEGDVTIRQVDLTGDTSTNYVHTLQVQQRDANRITFVASMNVGDGYTIVENGVLMTKDATKATAESFKLNTSGVIEGKIEATEGERTDIFAISKGKVEAGATWYGRAYMVVEKDGKQETVYADEILSKSYAG